jgi:serine/threonine protein kinase
MSAVYRAQDVHLARTVALKVLPQEFLHDRTFARRFEHEARVIASLAHDHIVPIYASGIDNGIPWMSMRLISGGHLVPASNSADSNRPKRFASCEASPTRSTTPTPAAWFIGTSSRRISCSTATVLHR